MTNEEYEITGDRVVLELGVTIHEYTNRLPDEPRAWFAKVLESPSFARIAPRASQWLRNAIDGQNPGPVDLSRWSNGDVAQASLASCAFLQEWQLAPLDEARELARLLTCMFSREAGLRLQERQSATLN